MSDDNDSEKVSTSKVATFFSKNGAWYAAAFFMLAVAFGLVLVFVLPNKHTNDSATTTPTTTNTAPPPLSSPAASPTSSSTPKATGWADLGCNGTKGSTSVPALAPDVSWLPVGTMSAPSSPSLGPKQVHGYVRTCFQHSPSGALVSAANLLVTSWTVPNAERKATLDQLMTPGVGRDDAEEPNTVTGMNVNVAAFRVLSCDADRCNIRLVFDIQGAYQYLDASMVWSGGDWKADGTEDADGGKLTSIPAGFTNWGA